jgi:hypothetical protein
MLQAASVGMSPSAIRALNRLIQDDQWAVDPIDPIRFLMRINLNIEYCRALGREPRLHGRTQVA